MLENSLEEGDDLGGEDLGSSESLGVEHHLGYELTVRLGHCKAGGRRKGGREGGRAYGHTFDGLMQVQP